MHGNLKKKVPKYSYKNHRIQLFRKLFLTKSSRICIWININFIENDHRIACKLNSPNQLPFTHICVHILCKFSKMGIIMTSQRCSYAHDPQNLAEIFYNARFATAGFRTSLANSGFVMDQIQLIHVIIGFKCDVPCIVRSKAQMGHEDQSVHEVHKQGTSC